MNKLVTKEFNIHNAKQFIESINEVSSDNYYVCFGKHTPYSNTDAIVDTPSDTLRYKYQTIYDDMIFGKKISSSDVKMVVRKSVWSSNTVYDFYDDQKDLSNSNFFVVTPSGSNYNVYKCLDNANGAPSTEIPSSVDTSVFTETDGYTWKYMYTITQSQWNKFSTVSYMPVYSNTQVIAEAADRSIDVILNEYSGSYYNNYHSGIFENGNQLVSSNVFRLSGDAVALNDYYKGCIIEFSSSSGYEYREITNYVVSGANRTITIDSPISNPIEVGDSYRIYPKIDIYGDGEETEKCIAWAIIDPLSSNSVSRVEILTNGSGYRQAHARVMFDESVNVSDEAILRPIISPINGHGSDPTKELLAHKICISVSVANTESNTIVAQNDFRNISIIKNPLFNDIELNYIETTNIFNIGETVYQYRPIQILGTVDANSSSYFVSGNSTFFSDSLVNGDKILIQNSSANFFTTVNNVISNTSITINDIPPGNISGNISLSIITSSGKVKSYSSNSIVITNVSNNFVVDSLVIGSESYSNIKISSIKNNSRNDNSLRTFQQTTRFIGEKTSLENFQDDELVYQEGNYSDESLRPSGRLFHYDDGITDTLYITNEKNNFSSNALIVGSSSNSVFVSTNKYNGDLIKDSGENLYINNVDAVTRSDSTSEIVKIVITF